MKKAILSFLLFIIITSRLFAMPIYPIRSPYLQGAFNTVARGDYAEANVNSSYFKRLNLLEQQSKGMRAWRNIQPRTGKQGIDHLFFKFDEHDIITNLLVAETKFASSFDIGSNPLGLLRDSNNQMGKDWVYSRLEGINERYRECLELEKNNMMEFKKPTDMNTDKIWISKDTYYYEELVYDANGNSSRKWFTFGSGDSVYRIQKATNVIDYIDGVINNNARIRLVEIVLTVDPETLDLKEFEYPLVFDDDGKPVRAVSDVTREILPPEIRIVSDDVLETDSNWRKTILNAIGLPDTSVEKKLTGDELRAIIVENREITKHTFDVITSSSVNRIAINRMLNLPDDFMLSRANLDKSDITEILKSSLKSKKDTFKPSAHLDNKLKAGLRRHYASGAMLNGSIGGIFGGGLEMLRQVVTEDKLDWGNIGIQAGIGFSFGAFTYVGNIITDKLILKTPLSKVFSNKAISDMQNAFYREYVSNITEKAATLPKTSLSLRQKIMQNTIRQSADALSDSTPKILLRGMLTDPQLLKSGMKVMGKQFTSGVMKNAIPGLFGTVLALGYDEYLLQTDESYDMMPQELKDAIRARNLKVEGLSLGTSLFFSGLSAVVFPSGTPGVFVAVDFVSGMLYEFLIPVPDGLDPDVLLEQYHNNNEIVATWADENLSNIVQQ